MSGSSDMGLLFHIWDDIQELSTSLDHREPSTLEADIALRLVFKKVMQGSLEIVVCLCSQYVTMGQGQVVMQRQQQVDF